MRKLLRKFVFWALDLRTYTKNFDTNDEFDYITTKESPTEKLFRNLDRDAMKRKTEEVVIEILKRETRLGGTLSNKYKK